MILVTGGTGLLGSHLLYELLLENKSVKAIYQKTSNLSVVKKVFSYYTTDFESFYKRIIWVEAELNDISSLELAFHEISFVYHCAAFISFNPSDYQIMRNINIGGTSNIVNLCIYNSVKKLCFVSSIAAVEKGNKKIADETEPWNNTVYKSGYSITKFGAEMEVWRASQEGVDVVIINPGVILGSGFWYKGTGKIFSLINNGFKFYTEGVTGFVGVKDVVKIMCNLMKSDIKNERFIVIAENLSYKNVFFLIADSLNKKRPKIKVSKFLSEIFWRLDYLKSKLSGSNPVMTKNNARSSQTKTFYSSKKIKTTTTFEFENIEKTITFIAKDFEN